MFNNFGRGNGRGGSSRRDNGGRKGGFPRAGGRNTSQRGIQLYDRDGRRVDPRAVAAMVKRSTSSSSSKSRGRSYGRGRDEDDRDRDRFVEPDDDMRFGDGFLARRIGWRL